MSRWVAAESGEHTLPGTAITSLCRSSGGFGRGEGGGCSAATATTASDVAALSDVRLTFGGVDVDGAEKTGLDRPEHGADANGIGTP